MEYREMVSEFIKQYGSYEAELKNFENYLLNGKKRPADITTLGGIRTDDIKSSINYNIRNNQYTSKSIAQKYITGIAQFYRYSISKKWFSNNELLASINASPFEEISYFASLNEYIASNSKLKNKISKDACTEEEVVMLLNSIDNFLSFSDKHTTKIGFERVAAMICIKLILFTGIKYSVAREIKLCDLNTHANTIEINQICIRLPINLSLQFQYYIRLRSKFEKELGEYLFVNYGGSQWGENTDSSKITYALKRSLGRVDTTGIIKYGLTSLLNAGIGIDEIKKLTRAGNDIIKGCSPHNDETPKQKLDRYMNMHICNMDIYYRL